MRPCSIRATCISSRRDAISTPTLEGPHGNAALRESEERFASFAASSSDALWIRDAETYVFQYVNPAVEAIFGVTPEAVLDDPELINSLIVPEQRGPISANVARICAGEKIVHEYQIKRPTDGTIRWIRSTGFPLRNEDGSIGRIGAIAQDVTERRRSEAARRASEERYRSLIKSIDTGYCVIEILFGKTKDQTDYLVLEVNPAFVRQTGLTDAVGKTMRAIAPAHEQFWYDTYARIAKTGQPERFEHRAEALGRWYSVFAFRVDEPDQHRVAVLFEDIKERKQIEVALLESEGRYRALATTGGASIYRMSADWRVMYQLDSTDFLARTIAPIEDWPGHYILPDDQPRVFAAIDEAIRERRLFDLEHRVRLADGSVGWVHSRAVPILGDNGEIIEWFGAGNDVTERRSALEKLKVSEEELRVALEAGRMGTYRLDIKTGAQSWSDRQYDIFGVPRGTVPTRDLFMSLVHPDDHVEVEFSLDDIREPGTYLDSEFRIIRSDGETRWITAHALALFDSQNRPVGLIGVNQDVTERRRLEAAMHASEERLREFGEASSDVMWIRGARDLQWEYLSPAFHAIYGISRQDALRGDNFLSWQHLVLAEDREAALANIEKVRNGERVNFEYRIRRPEDGQIRWLRNTDFPMSDEQGNIVRIGGIGHDITPLKQSEEHQKLLTAELQHRVRNTLAVIRSIARRTAVASETVEDFAMNLEGRIEAFARVQSVVTRDPAAGVDIAMLVAEELRSASAHEGNALTIDGPDTHLRAKPAETFALGIHELVTNAIKHGALLEHGARIAISWVLDGEVIRFRWKESGVTTVAPSRRAGLGTEILTRTLPYELGGTARFSIEPDGVAYDLEMPGSVIQPS